MLRALAAELAKLRRSRVPLWTVIVVALWPISSIASLAATTGSLRDIGWEQFVRIGPQTMTSWYGVVLSGYVASFMFGREYSEGTARNMLALPVRREYFVISKLIVLIVWVFALGTLSAVVNTAYGAILGLDGFAWRYALTSLRESLLVATILVATLPLVGWIAVVGRGYLAPMLFSGVAFMSGVLMLQAGWERWYPWAMPYAVTGLLWLPGDTSSSLGASSWAILAALFVAGVAALVAHIDLADSLE